MYLIVFSGSETPVILVFDIFSVSWVGLLTIIILVTLNSYEFIVVLLHFERDARL
ncbi:hypothetical protein D3C83_333930 [compost metagenome]